MTGYPRYSFLQRLIHWTVAIIALGVLTGGVILGTYGFTGLKDAYGIEVTNFIYKYHKSFGVVLLGLMTLRILVLLMTGKPDYDPPLTAFQKSASAAVHGLLYLALLTQPVLGWLATSAGGFPVEFFAWTLPGLLDKDKELSETLYGLHGSVGWLIIALLVLHIGAALMHRFVKRDTVMHRMSLF